MATGTQRIDEMVKVLRTWQGLERQAMYDTAEILETAQNPLVRILMEIIRHDSLMHHRVQQFLIDSVTVQDVTVTREEVGEIWEKIEEHDRVEKRTIGLAKELREKAWSPIHKQLLDYLLTDEQKHDKLLEHLQQTIVGMTKTSGG